MLEGAAFAAPFMLHGMNHDDALAEVERLRREHPERATNDWIAQPLGDPAGDWRVVKIALPEGVTRPGGTVVGKPEKADVPDDPRSAFERNVGGPYGVG